MAVKLFDYLFFTRPLLQIPVWTVYLHYLQFCKKSGFGAVTPGQDNLLILAALTLAFAGTYIINQIYDIESDRLNRKLHFLPNGLITITQAWVSYTVISLAAALFAWLTDMTAARIVFLIIILGVLYSIPKIRLKDNMLGGLLANAVAFGLLIPAAAGLDCASGMERINSIPYFLAVATGYILTTIPDLDGDAATRKKTVAVILGPRLTLILALLTAFATAFAAFVFRNYELVAIATVTAVLIISLLVKITERLLLFTCKFPILLLALLTAAHFPLYPGILLLTILLTRLYYRSRFGIVYPKLG